MQFETVQSISMVMNIACTRKHTVDLKKKKFKANDVNDIMFLVEMECVSISYTQLAVNTSC